MALLFLGGAFYAPEVSEQYQRNLRKTRDFYKKKLYNFPLHKGVKTKKTLISLGESGEMALYFSTGKPLDHSFSNYGNNMPFYASFSGPPRGRAVRISYLPIILKSDRPF